MKQLTVSTSVSLKSLRRLEALGYTVMIVSKIPKVYSVKADKILRGKYNE